MKVANPKAFLIAKTHVNWAGKDFHDALREIGAQSWVTEASTDGEALVEFAGKLCYMSFDTALNANLTRTGTRSNAEYIQQQLIATKHGSVLEHATATFLLTNVSRVVTHELVRHRAGTAFSQVSGRYVRAEPAFYFPRVLRQADAARIFHQMNDRVAEAVRELEQVTAIDEQSFSMKKMLTSAIRRIMGNGQATHIVVTANHRAWRHIIESRTAAGAEEEIRDVIGQVADKLKEAFPAIYADCYKSAKPDALGLYEYKFTSTKV